MKKLFLQLDGGKVAYLSAGQGENLILLHSLNLSAESWKEVFEPLVRNYTVYALDMLGHGDSDPPPINYLIEDYARNVIAFMDRLQIGQAMVCGNSVGALIALEMAASFPKRVEKLALVGCPARDSWDRLERLTLSSLAFDIQGNPRPYTLADIEQSFAHPTKELLIWFNQGRAKAGPWVKKTLIAIALYDVLLRLPRVPCPTLVLFGEKDILRDQENTLLQGIRGAKKVLIEDAGHVPQIERPQAFLAEINRFLSSS